MINDKDRSQLLRMAGNIACGFVTSLKVDDMYETWENDIATASARIALKTMKSLDALIMGENDKAD